MAVRNDLNMAEEVKTKAATSASAPGTAIPAATVTAPGEPWWKSVLVQRWLAALVIVSLVLHFTAFVLLRKSVSKTIVQPEFTVGTFTLTADEHGYGHGTSGKFDLHVRFIDDLDATARTRMTSHEFRVRESIENLLRGAQGIELNEQILTRLKHQIQDRIDDAIDMRAVAEVLITDLTIPMPAAVPATVPVAAPASTPTTIPTAAPAPNDSAANRAPADSVSKSTVSAESGGGF